MSESAISFTDPDGGILGKVEHRDNGIDCEIWFPPRGEPENAAQIKYVCVGMEDNRGTDGFRASYDFTRDGWKIEQPNKDWIYHETAFIKSWVKFRPGD